MLEQYLQCFSNQQQENWVEVLALAEFAFNNTQHASTRVSLFFASYRFHPWLFLLAPLDSPVLAVDMFLQVLCAILQVMRT